MVFALPSYILLLLFSKDQWTIFVVIFVYSAAAGKVTAVQVMYKRQKVAGNCMTGGKGVEEFHFPM